MLSSALFEWINISFFFSFWVTLYVVFSRISIMEIQQQVLVISQFSLSLIQAWCIRLIWVTWVTCELYVALVKYVCHFFFKQTFTCELALVCVGTFFAPTSQAAMWQQDVRLSWLALKFTCDNSCCVGVLLCQKSDLWALYSEGFSTSMHRSWAEQHWSLSPRLQFQAALCAMPACTEVNDMCLSRFLYW